MPPEPWVAVENLCHERVIHLVEDPSATGVTFCGLTLPNRTQGKDFHVARSKVNSVRERRKYDPG